MSPGLVVPGVLYGVASIAFLLHQPRPIRERFLVTLILFHGIWGFLTLASGKHAAVQVSFAVLLGALVAREIGARLRRGRAADGDEELLLVFVGLHLVQMFNPNWSGLRAGILSGTVAALTHLLPMGLYLAGRRLGAGTETGAGTGTGTGAGTGAPEGIPVVLRTVLFVGTLTVLYGIVQVLLGEEHVMGLGPAFHETVELERLWNPFGILKPPSFGRTAGQSALLYLLTAVLAFAGLAGVRSFRSLAGYALLGLLASLALAFTFIRTWMAVLVLMVGLVAIRIRRLMPILVAALVLLLPAAHVATRGLSTHRLRAILDLSGLAESRSDTLASFGAILRRLPQGGGSGRVGPGAGRFANEVDRQYLLAVESYPVALWFDYGVLGVLILGTFLGRVALRTVRLYLRSGDETDVVSASILLGFLVAMGVTPLGYGPPANFLVWLLAGAVTAREAALVPGRSDAVRTPGTPAAASREASPRA